MFVPSYDNYAPLSFCILLAVHGQRSGSGQDLLLILVFCDKKLIPAGGGGPGRFPRLFVAADIVWGCWARVGSFSDRFRVFFMHKSPPPRLSVLPPPSRPRPPARQPHCSNGKCSETPGKLPNHDIFALAEGMRLYLDSLIVSQNGHAILLASLSELCDGQKRHHYLTIPCCIDLSR